MTEPTVHRPGESHPSFDLVTEALEDLLAKATAEGRVIVAGTIRAETAPDGRTFNLTAKTVAAEVVDEVLALQERPGAWPLIAPRPTLEARPVNFGQVGEFVVREDQPNQRDLYLGETQVGRAWVPHTVVDKPQAEWHWVCAVDTGHGEVVTQADSLDVALAGAQTMLNLQNGRTG